jgi:hypothetical protein
MTVRLLSRALQALVAAQGRAPGALRALRQVFSGSSRNTCHRSRLQSGGIDGGGGEGGDGKDGGGRGGGDHGVPGQVANTSMVSSLRSSELMGLRDVLAPIYHDVQMCVAAAAAAAAAASVAPRDRRVFPPSSSGAAAATPPQLPDVASGVYHACSGGGNVGRGGGGGGSHIGSIYACNLQSTLPWLYPRVHASTNVDAQPDALAPAPGTDAPRTETGSICAYDVAGELRILLHDVGIAAAAAATRESAGPGSRFKA